jgi:response regulator of citrate/malate metabolism
MKHKIEIDTEELINLRKNIDLLFKKAYKDKSKEELENTEEYKHIIPLLKHFKEIDYSTKNTTKARKTRQNKVKEKIKNTLNLMYLEQEEFTIYSLAKAAEISYQTCKKYKYLFEDNPLLKK